MSGIYIPGMKMPKVGCFIVFHDGEVWRNNKRIGRVGTAIELPPHGDLIDREKIPFVEAEYACDDYAFRYDINEMTPVIPAGPEGGSDNG